MAAIQNSTNEVTKTDEALKIVPYEMLNATQQAMVDYKALNGIVISKDTGDPEKMTVDELAGIMRVTRDAMYKAMSAVPNFWDLVSERRKMIASQTRLAKVHSTWFLMAASGKNWPATEAYIRNFDAQNYVEPKQKVEHDIGASLADLISAHRQKQAGESPKVIEADVTDVKSDS